MTKEVKKIAVVCDVLGKENNGTTSAAMNLIRSLKEKGYEVKVICNDEERRGEEGYYIVPELKIPIVKEILHRNGVKLSVVDKRVMDDALSDVDHVHVMIPFALGGYASKYCHEHNVSLTAGFHAQAENFTSHLGMMHCDFLNRLFYKYIYRNVYRYTDCIHYPTQFIKEEFESVVGETKGEVISNGVNGIFSKKEVPPIARYQGKFVILNIGRLCAEKNQSVLIKAVARSKYKDKIQLVLAGAGPDRKKLMQLANKLGVNVENEFYSRSELVEIINNSDLYCHPSEMEIEAIGCMEAIRCGVVPVISDSKKSATSKFALDEKSLFINDDADDLARKIDYWIEHEEERKEYSLRYLSSATAFDQAYCMDKMEEMILKTHEGKKYGEAV